MGKSSVKASREVALQASEQRTKGFKAFRKSALAQLPSYFDKLTGGYRYRVFWFEIFECVRKICLIGIPVFFDPGVEQTLIGLMICFVTMGIYAGFWPFLDLTTNALALTCQVQVFFSLLASLLIKFKPEAQKDEAIGFMLSISLAIPFLCAILFSAEAAHNIATILGLHRGGCLWRMCKNVAAPLYHYGLRLRYGRPGSSKELVKKAADKVLPNQNASPQWAEDELSTARSHGSELSCTPSTSSVEAATCRPPLLLPPVATMDMNKVPHMTPKELHDSTALPAIRAGRGREEE